MTSRIERLLIALMFALLAAGVTLIFASAQGEVPPAGQTSPDCLSCHTEFQLTWSNGAHGNADGVTCESCHGALQTDHPKTPMPVDRSPDKCVACHSSTSFGVQNWKESKHYQMGMECVNCHDPHAAALKTIAGPRGKASSTDNVSALCINCHKESSMNFPFTAHAQRNVSCVDCHVKHLGSTDPTAKTIPDHSFKASLDSCNSCHAQQMHDPTQAKTPEGTSAPLSLEAAAVVPVAAAVTPEPEPVSPMGFSALAGLIGLCGGMVLAPWLERWYRRTIKREEDHE